MADELEHRLREENRWLRSLLDGVTESAVIFAPDGRILYVNRQAARALREATGVKADEIVGKTSAELGVSEERRVRPVDGRDAR